MAIFFTTWKEVAYKVVKSYAISNVLCYNSSTLTITEFRNYTRLFHLPSTGTESKFSAAGKHSH